MTENTDLPIKLTYQEVLDRYQEEATFLAWVDHNPIGKGKRTKLQFFRCHQYGDIIGSWVKEQENIDGVDYSDEGSWKYDYTGLFEIVDEYMDRETE